MNAPLVTDRVRKVTAVASGLSKRLGDVDVTAIPYPTRAFCSGWAFGVEGHAQGAKFGLRVLDTENVDAIVESAYHALDDAGIVAALMATL